MTEKEIDAAMPVDPLKMGLRKTDTGEIFLFSKGTARRSDMELCPLSFVQSNKRIEEPVGSIPPVGDPNRLVMIKEAIGKLPSEHYTGKGLPDAARLTTLLGWESRPVSAIERNEAWEMYKG